MVEALPVAEIVHTMAGRARLRVSARRGDDGYFASAAAELSSVANVHKVEVNPFTGSILILHSASLTRIGAAAQEAALFKMATVPAAASMEQAIAIDPKILIGAGLGVLALSELIQGRIVPPAITLAWYAANLTGLVSSVDSANRSE
jgi:hypothetical protein